MDGMTTSAPKPAVAVDLTTAPRRLRPRDAATLILLERRASGVHVLMGRRHERHAFMPGKLVFPGGRTDPEDSRVVPSTDLHPHIAAQFSAIGKSAARTRAIALSAIRETYEEAGMLVGRRSAFVCAKPGWQGFVAQGVAPCLDNLRYVARAITPPGSVRRFDAHFFAAWRDCVAVELPQGGPTQELQDLAWLPVSEAREADVPDITRTVLGELSDRLAADRRLTPAAGPVPLYRMVRDRFLREIA